MSSQEQFPLRPAGRTGVDSGNGVRTRGSDPSANIRRSMTSVPRTYPAVISPSSRSDETIRTLLWWSLRAWEQHDHECSGCQ